MSAHGPDHVHEALPRGAESKRRLSIALALTGTYLVVEVVGSYLTGSLALLADAGHMLTDAGGLALALFAIRLADKKATPQQTYGYYRAEILAALLNGVALLGLSAFVLYEAVGRFLHPPEVQSHLMVAIAVLGLVVNGIGIVILRGGTMKSLNVRAAYFEVVSDAATSAAVVVAAVVMWTTGWYYADPILSAAIGFFIFPRTYRLIREAVGILLEGTPSQINLAALREALADTEGVAGVHDLHVWSLTSGMHAMSVHVVRKDGEPHDEVLRRVQHRIREGFDIGHATVQVESAGCGASEVHL